MKIFNRNAITNAAIFIAVFVAALKLGDMAIGMIIGIDPGPSSTRNLILREPAPNYVRIAKPDKELLANSDGLEEKSVVFRVDQDGFIVGPTNPNGDVDIAFVGGSTTECKYVAEDVRFPALVSRLLKRKAGDFTRTINAGYSGNNMMHDLLVILAKVLPYKPHFVVIMENVNDLGQLEKTGSYWNGPQSRALVQYPNTKSTNTLSYWGLLAKNLLFPNSWEILRPYLGRMFIPKLVDEFADYRGKSIDSVPFDEAIRQYTAALRTVVLTVKAWGSKPVLMTQFNRFQLDDAFVAAHSGMSQDDYKNFVIRYKQFNDIVRKVAREERVYLIDLDNEVPHTSKYMIDTVHLNDEGSNFVAQVIAKHIAKHTPEYVLNASQ